MLQSVELTHPDRVLYPEQGITKADLALYYARVADAMLPQLARRPLMLVRCPQGQRGACFHQKHPGRGVASSIHRFPLREKKGTFESMFVEDADGLLQLVQIDALEIHTWGSRVDRLDCPDQLSFDLDPDESLAWARTVEAANDLKQLLERLGLASYAKTTGGKGLHLVVPIHARTPWDEARAFCKAVAERMVAGAPDRYLATISKEKRKGKILIDYLRNSRGATAVCVYSTRARAGAPVSVPIAWNELTPQLRPDQFDTRSVPRRLAEQRQDPWRGFEGNRATLSRSLLKARPG